MYKVISMAVVENKSYFLSLSIIYIYKINYHSVSMSICVILKYSSIDLNWINMKKNEKKTSETNDNNNLRWNNMLIMLITILIMEKIMLILLITMLILLITMLIIFMTMNTKSVRKWGNED